MDGSPISSTTPDPTWSVRFDLRLDPSRNEERPALYRAALELASRADEKGCSSFILSEHHGADDGYLPSGLTFAAAVGALTARARLNISALILPLHDPIRAAEETLVVDQLSAGRVDVIVGLGYVRSEYAMHGLDPSERVAILEAKLPVYLDALTGEPFSIDGRTVRVTPGPVQQPRPTVLLAASVPAAARRAARLADGVHCLVPRSELEPHYVQERERLGLGRGLVAGGEGSSGSVFVSDDPERAWQELGPYILHEINGYGRWAVENAANQHLYQPTDDLDVARAMGMHVILTPDEAAAQLVAAATSGLMLNPLVGGLPLHMAEPYFAAFVEQALPLARLRQAEYPTRASAAAGDASGSQRG
jgi:alkanesulfonate monooxygenase SsuD/methylene tetrahydromethanopterin reductase-like flavin-dependent oxidoreductase (luciferase family)